MGKWNLPDSDKNLKKMHLREKRLCDSQSHEYKFRGKAPLYVNQQSI